VSAIGDWLYIVALLVVIYSETGDPILLGLFGAVRSIPYIVLSGDRDIAQKARQCGADDYMGKPFEFADLIRLVDKYARTESGKAH